MRAKTIRFVVLILLGSAAFAQVAVEKNFRSTQPNTAQGFRVIVDVIRMIAETEQVSADAESGTLAVHGTAEQVALAEWLFLELDRQAPRDPAGREYLMQGSSIPVVRIVYLTHIDTPQNFQEIMSGAPVAGRLSSKSHCLAGNCCGVPERFIKEWESASAR